jgi:hypothetical protein
VTPLIHALCAPTANPAAPRAANIGRFVGAYDSAPGALRVLCDALLREWLQGGSPRGSGGGGDGGHGDGAAAAELQVIFHQLLELLLDPERNTCGSPRLCALTSQLLRQIAVTHSAHGFVTSHVQPVLETECWIGLCGHDDRPRQRQCKVVGAGCFSGTNTRN